MIGQKDNQPNLCGDVAEYFMDAWDDPHNYPEIHATETFEKGHGRIEQRKYYLTTNIEWLSCKEQWGGLCVFGAVRSKVSKGDDVSEAVRYYITSLRDACTFAKTARHIGELRFFCTGASI